MTEKIKEALSNDSVIPISLGLLIVIFSSLSVGVWNLSEEIASWKNRMNSFDQRLEQTLGAQWSYHMARESWSEFRRLNPDIPVPDVEKIRKAYLEIYARTH